MTRLKAPLILLAASLLFCELVLQVAAQVSLSVGRLLAAPWVTWVVPDPSLMNRGNPLTADHDAWGYRNESRPTYVEIVTLGDSNTHGIGDPAAAWPRVLAKDTHRVIYNMALPTYGPVHNWFQLDEAFSLKPAMVVQAVYFGNDFADSFFLSRRRPEFKAAMSAELRQAAEDRERQEPLDGWWPFGQGGAAPEGQAQRLSPLHRILSEDIKLYGLARAVKYRLIPYRPPYNPLIARSYAIARESLSAHDLLYAVPFEGNGWRTILTPGYRGRPVDHHDPRIRLGFDVTLHAIQLMAERCREKKVGFLVVILPTKEMTFWPHIQDAAVQERIHDLVSNEEQLRSELFAFLEAHQIRYVDTLGALRQSGPQPYYEDVDGHLNDAGHQVVARTVGTLLGQTSAGLR